MSSRVKILESYTSIVVADFPHHQTISRNNYLTHIIIKTVEQYENSFRSISVFAIDFIASIVIAACSYFLKIR